MRSYLDSTRQKTKRRWKPKWLESLRRCGRYLPTLARIRRWSGTSGWLWRYLPADCRKRRCRSTSWNKGRGWTVPTSAAASSKSTCWCSQAQENRQGHQRKDSRPHQKRKLRGECRPRTRRSRKRRNPTTTRQRKTSSSYATKLRDWRSFASCWRPVAYSPWRASTNSIKITSTISSRALATPSSSSKLSSSTRICFY